jgi:hypothetical protein
LLLLVIGTASFLALDQDDQMLRAAAAENAADSPTEAAKHQARKQEAARQLARFQKQIIPAYWLAGGLLIVTQFLFLIWKYRANATLRQMGVYWLRFSPAGCVGWYFVPVFNLFRPYQAMQELWKDSEVRSSRHSRGRSSELVLTWWLMCIAGGVAAAFIEGERFWSGHAAEAMARVDARAEGESVDSRSGGSDPKYGVSALTPFICAYGVIHSIVSFTLVTKLANRLKSKLAAAKADEADNADDVPLDVE